MPFTPLAGKDCAVKVGAVSYAFRVADVQIESKLGDVMNFTSGGAQTLIAGPFKGKVMCRGPLDAANMTFTVNTAYTLDIEYSATITYSLPTICESIKIGADVEKPDEAEVVFQTTGTFTPTFPI